MPLYRYKAVSPSGEVSEGEFEAPQESAAVERVRDLGLLPVRIDLAQPGTATVGTRESLLSRLFRKRKVSAEDVTALTRELATLLRAGLPLDRALEILINLSTSDPVRLLLQQIRDDVRGGTSLSQALDAQKGHFSRFYVNIIRAGEAGGALPAVLLRLTEFLERSKELRDTVVSALIYPTILIAVAVLSVMLLLIYVVPQFSQVFHDAGKALPFATQVVIASGNFLRYYWWTLVLGAIAVAYWWRGQRARPASRYKWDGRFLRWPVFGDLIAKIEVARFARTLGTLLGNGVSLLAGLSIVKDTMTNTVLAGALDGVIAKLREGEGLGRPLMQSGIYPKLAIHMVLVGEETGRLEEMLLRVADIYDREVNLAIKRMLGIFEPLLILGLAALIAGIILSILIALLSINDLAT